MENTDKKNPCSVYDVQNPFYGNLLIRFAVVYFLWSAAGIHCFIREKILLAQYISWLELELEWFLMYLISLPNSIFPVSFMLSPLFMRTKSNKNGSRFLSTFLPQSTILSYSYCYYRVIRYSVGANQMSTFILWTPLLADHKYRRLDLSLFKFFPS